MAKLNIITPFKGDIQDLISTINSLINSYDSPQLSHVIVSDSSCFDSVTRALYSFSHNQITFKLLIAAQPGIYEAINQALGILHAEDWYIVLGAGDLLIINDIPDFTDQFPFYLIPYNLSSQELAPPRTSFRYIYSGMPYCHNAMIFKKDTLAYSRLFRISADYDYFLEKLSSYSSPHTICANSPVVDSMHVVFDDINGVSSTRKLKLHCESIFILNQRFGLFSLVRYLLSRLWINLSNAY